MKRLLSILAFCTFLAVPAFATLKIVATTPELADIVRQVGGDRVEVVSLAKGTEDVHAVPQRPSFLPKLNRADGLVLQGMEIEHAFLPALLEVSQNSRILPGAKGYMDCSVYITPKDVPASLDRSQGELHPRGNPHYNIDPRNGPKMVRAISEGLARLDPPNAAVYERDAKAYSERIAALVKTLSADNRFRGIKAVSHHPDMVYLADFLGLELVGTVEPKPGIPPSPTHLEALAKKMKDEKVSLILREIQYSDKTARWLAQQTGAKIATVSTMALPEAPTYIGLIEGNINAIRKALTE